MKTIGTIALGSGALGLALLAQTALCAAQTSVMRQITTGPVETTIAQGPNGTIVTRRPLDPTPDPGAPAFVPGPLHYSSPPVGTLGQSGVYQQDVDVVPAAPRHGDQFPRKDRAKHAKPPSKFPTRLNSVWCGIGRLCGFVWSWFSP